MARAPVSKFYRDRPGHSLRITERPDLSALLECPGVPRPFPSRLVPQRSVATDANCSRPGFAALGTHHTSIVRVHLHAATPQRGSSSEAE